VEEARNPNRAGFAVLGSAVVLVALLTTVVLLVLSSAVHLRLAKVERRQTTMLDWEEARAVSDVIVGGGRWRVTEVLAPCGSANPEALIVLTSGEAGTSPLGDVKAATDHLDWDQVDSGDQSSVFAAKSSSGRVRVVVERSGNSMQAELGVDESCR
jgi:hypothetical protein